MTEPFVKMPAVVFKLMVAVLMLSGSIASLKVALMAFCKQTPDANSKGLTFVIVGAMLSGAAPVENVHTLLLSKALPAKSNAPVVTVAVNKVLKGKLAGLVGHR